jgi:hypothetical protein
MMLRNLIFVLFFLSAISLLIASCDPAGVQQESSFDLIQSKILTPSCAISSCHAAESDAFYAQHQLILTAGKSYQNLVGILSFNAAANDPNFAVGKITKIDANIQSDGSYLSTITVAPPAS